MRVRTPPVLPVFASGFLVFAAGRSLSADSGGTPAEGIPDLAQNGTSALHPASGADTGGGFPLPPEDREPDRHWHDRLSESGRVERGSSGATAAASLSASAASAAAPDLFNANVPPQPVPYLTDGSEFRSEDARPGDVILYLLGVPLVIAIDGNASAGQPASPVELSSITNLAVETIRYPDSSSFSDDADNDLFPSVAVLPENPDAPSPLSVRMPDVADLAGIVTIGMADTDPFPSAELLLPGLPVISSRSHDGE